VLLAWDTAAQCSIGLVAAATGARLSRRPRAIVASAYIGETAIVLGLYALWQWAGALGSDNVAGAAARGRWIWDFEHTLHWPSELSVEHLVMSHRLLSQSLNLYYLTAHVPALVALLVWLFVRHRPSYVAWRNAGALLTGICLVIQLIPVAPPRLLPELGFVDLAAKYGQSVYGPGGLGNATQVAALPSVHVAWAAYIAIIAICVSKSKWRWLVLAHPIVTMFVVVATANHWWLDGVVAVALIPVCYAIQAGATAAVGAARRRRSAEHAPELLGVLHGVPASIVVEEGIARADVAQEVGPRS
jgi:hypothetical protein